MDILVIVLYLGAMVGIGWYAKRRARTESDFLVAGRRLGPVYYTGTMAALVMGGGATLGGIGLGYQHGLSGAWLVFAMATGVALISLLLAPLINRLRVYTVSQMLVLRYGEKMGTRISGVVMLAYTLMIAVTSTVACGSIATVFFGIPKVPTILICGSVVILYSALGGMWSITFTDLVQFLLKTVSIFVILLPAALLRAGGFEGLAEKLPPQAFSWTEPGLGPIFMYLVLQVPTMVIGQDLWQRVFTARSDQVARWAGVGAAAYCYLYGLAGALIGMCARVLLPNVEGRDQVYAQIVHYVLPVGLAGLVVAGALAAMMSTASGALIATATVAKEDVLGRASEGQGGAHSEVSQTRVYIVFSGVAMAVIACLLQDVIAALTVASDFLVGGLLVAVIGGMVWKGGTARGALVSIVIGVVTTLGTMLAMGDIFANMPIYLGLSASLLSFVAVSLLDGPVPAAVRERWERRAQGLNVESEARELAGMPDGRDEAAAGHLH